MKNFAIKTFTLISTLFCGSYTAQNAGVVTETFQVSGNCGMCKKTIEKAAALKGVRSADWNTAGKVLTLKYDPSRTSASEVLRQVAYAGYDNEKYIAPEEAYRNLHGCCQYDRDSKKTPHASAVTGSMDSGHQSPAEPAAPAESGIQKVYDAYFAIKDALVKSDRPAASAAAENMVRAVETVNMDGLGKKEHDVFMKLRDELITKSKNISREKNIEKQRKSFSELSQTVYELMKAIKPAGEVYLDHCPMYNDGKGADWLSREKNIRNPYYGAKMMTCGNVKETLK